MNHNLMNELISALAHAIFCAVAIVATGLAAYFIVKNYVRFFQGLKRLDLKTGIDLKGLPIGRHGIREVFIPFDGEAHMNVISTSGGGKTHKLLTHVIEAWMEYPSHAGFYIDISGDIVDSIEVESSKLIFDPLNDDSTVVYDVFGEINSLNNEVYQLDALDTLSFLLIPENASQDTASYYERTGRELLQATLISYFFEGFSFYDVCQRVCSATVEDLIDELTSISNPKASDKIAHIEGLDPPQKSNIYDAVHAALIPFAMPMVSAAFDVHRPGVTVISSADIEEHHIFFAIPDNKLQQYAQLVRVVTSQIMDHISARPPYSGKKILLAIDEFASFGKLDIQAALEKYRKRNCKVLILYQDVNQLIRNLSEAEKEVMFANFGYTLCLGTPGQATQQYLADMIGKRQMIKKTFSSKMGLSITEKYDYPVQPYQFGKCRHSLYVIRNNEYIRLRKLKYK